MPLGIVSNKDFESELTNSSPEHRPVKEEVIRGETVITGEVIRMPTPGRHEDVTNVPQSLRKLLGETVALEGLSNARKLADSFGGISQPTLSTYGRGEVSPGQVNQDLSDYVNGRKTKVTKKALNKLTLAMNLIDETKLGLCDAKELSSVAKDMATIVKTMEPEKTEDKKVDPVQFIMFAPQVKTENHYETVVAKDNY